MALPLAEDYSALCVADIRAFYSKHNAAKLNDVDKIVSDAKAKNISSRQMFEMLYKRYGVIPFQNLDRILENTCKLYPTLTKDEILHELRKVELKGVESMAEHGDAYLSALGKIAERKRAASVAGERSLAREPHRMATLSATESKAKIDSVMANEARDWLIETLGEDAPESLRNASPDDFTDCLRDGVLLHVLLQKLQNPSLRREDIKKPKSFGFHGRDNVSSFIRAVRGPPFNLRPEVLFTDVDLCDGKAPRNVVTCLLALAKIAYFQNRAPAPAIVRFEKEIDEQQRSLPSDVEIDRLIETDDLGATVTGLARLEEEMSQIEDKETEARRLIQEEENRVRRLALHVLRSIMEDIREEIQAVRQEEAVGQKLPQCNVTHLSASKRAALPTPSAPMLLLVQSNSPARGGDPSWQTATDPQPSADNLGSPLHYVHRRGDEVDKHVSKAVNKIYERMKQEAPKTKIKRLKQQGQYVIYHKITGKRTVVFVRVVQKQLMIRVGGGWEDFEEYLQRRMVEWDQVPRNRLNHPEALPPSKR